MGRPTNIKWDGQDGEGVWEQMIQINAKAKRSIASLGLDFVGSEVDAIWGCFYKDNDTGLWIQNTKFNRMLNHYL